MESEGESSDREGAEVVVTVLALFGIDGKCIGSSSWKGIYEFSVGLLSVVLCPIV